MSKKIKAIIIVALLMIGATLYAQTNPTPQTLPYSQDFSGLAHSSTTYPAGWQGWTISTSPGSSFNTAPPTADRSLTANSTASITSGNVHNYDGKIGYLNTASLDLTIALAINTTGQNNISVTYDIMTIRNPYDGGTNTRINEVTLQYRVGTSGSFTTLTGIEYQNNTVTQTGAVTTPQNLQTKNITLPIECNNQAVVQLRWASRQVSGGGSRPSFAVDDINITGSGAPNPPTKLAITSINGGISPSINIPFSVTVQAQDNDNNPANVSTATGISLSLATGSGSLSGTLTGTITAGTNSVTITGVTYNTAEAGVSITASRTSGDVLTPGTSESFTVLPAATQLAFVGVPAGAQLNIKMAPFTVQARRADNSVDLNYIDSITISKASGTGNVYGKLKKACVAGIATFDSVCFDAPGTYTLSANATGLTGATSSSINVLPVTMPLIEDFDYTNGTSLTYNGWAAHSGVGLNPIMVTSPSLTYSGYLSSDIGNAARVDTTGEDVNKTFTSQTSGAVYAAFMAKVEKATLTNDYFFHLGPSPIGTTYMGRVHVKKDASDNLAFGLGKGPGDTTYTAFDYALNTTYLFVLKYEIVAGTTNDSASLFIFTSGVPTNEPLTPTLVSKSTGTDPANIGSVALRQGTAANAPRVIVDGIRVGRTWTEILFPSTLPTKLAVTSINGGISPTVNIPFSVTVQAQDNDNNPANVSAATEISLSLATGSGSLGGTLTGTITAGTHSVTISGVTYNTAQAGVSITASRTSGDILTPGTSALFTVLPAATQLAFVGVPAAAQPEIVMGTFKVEARRPDNSVDNTYTGNVTISKNSGPGNVTGTLTKPCVNGIATFDDIICSESGIYTLDAVSAGLTGATSSSINVLTITFPFVENFEYPAGTSLTYNGWSPHSASGSNPMLVTTPGLTYPDYLSSGIGEATTVIGGSGSREDAHRIFSSQSSGSVYTTFMVRVTAATTTEDYFLHLGHQTIGTTFRGRVFVKKDASNNLAFGLSMGSSTASEITQFDYALNTTYLIVLKYTFIDGTNNDEVKLWINPPLVGTEPLSDLTHTDASITDLTNVGSVALRQGTQAYSVIVDGIRISNSWGGIMRDVGVVEVLAPAGEVRQGSTVVPKAKIKNYGNVSVSAFDVIFTIGEAKAGEYTDTVTISGLDVNQESIIHFDNYNVTGTVDNVYNTEAKTNLDGDMYAPNNIAYGGGFQVIEPLVSRWTQLADSMPPAYDVKPGKSVKDGGSITAVSSGDNAGIYAFPGNKSRVFRKYVPGVKGTWYDLESIPFGYKLPLTDPPAINNKKIAKGASLCYDGNNTIYATKGNGTKEFWAYYINPQGEIPGDTWIAKAFLTLVNNPLKGGTSLAYYGGKVYLLAGGQKLGFDNFFSYDTTTNIWTSLAQAKTDPDNKVYKDGSCIVAHNAKIYALKGGSKNNYLYTYNISSGNWNTTYDSVPLLNAQLDKKNKISDGAAMTVAGNVIYLVKGGGKQDFYKYSLSNSSWTELETIPKGPGGKKRVPKTGAALAYYNNNIYLLKGNNSPELWAYGPLSKSKSQIPDSKQIQNSNVQIQTSSKLAEIGQLITVNPNPTNKNTVIRYSVPITGNVSIKLYNTSGSLIKTLMSGYHSVGDYVLNLSNLENGIYFLKFENNTNKAELKLIVQ